MFTPIPDRKAMLIVNKDYRTIRNAAKRGALTRIPMAGQVQHVAEEQVNLFKGKSQITLDALSPDELRDWQRYRDEILSTRLSAQVDQQPQVPAIDYKLLAKNLIDELSGRLSGQVNEKVHL